MAPRSAERNGFTTKIFIIDCSVSMGQLVQDPELDRDPAALQKDRRLEVLGSSGGEGPILRSKLQWAKEYVMRKVFEQIFSNRKTEKCMVLATGDKTNNAYDGYDGIDLVFPSSRAGQWMIPAIQALKAGTAEGDVLAASNIAVASLGLDLRKVDEQKPTWSTDFHILTDGESSFGDPKVQIDQFLQSLTFFNNKEIVLIVYGLHDKYWQKHGGTVPTPEDPFTQEENERLFKGFKRSAQAKNVPMALLSLSRALSYTRAPQLRTVKPTATSSTLRLAVEHFSEKQAAEAEKSLEHSLSIPVKVGKMTDASTALKKPKVKPAYVSEAGHAPAGESQSLSQEQKEKSDLLRADLQLSGIKVPEGMEGEALVRHLEKQGGDNLKEFDKEQLSLFEHFRDFVSASVGASHIAPAASSTLWNVLSADLQPQYFYTSVDQPGEDGGPTEADGEQETTTVADEASLAQTQAQSKFDSVFVPEQISRGHKFGSGWIPVENGEDGKPVKIGAFHTLRGIDICKFIPAATFDRTLEMGEVRYIWADPNSAKSQVEISALVHAMLADPEQEMMAVVRFVYSDGLAPSMMVAKAVKNESRDHLQCVRVPMRDDERRYLFPSLEFPRTEKRELVTEHSTLPTKAHMSAMKALVDSLVIDTLGENEEPWFAPDQSYNPQIHILKAFSQHQFLATPGDPLPPMHSALTTYFNPPQEIVGSTKVLGKRVADELDLRPVPAKKAKKRGHDVVSEEEVDLFEMFGTVSSTFPPDEPMTNAGEDVKPREVRAVSPVKKEEESATEDEDEPDHKEPVGAARTADKALLAFEETWKGQGTDEEVTSAIAAVSKEITGLVKSGARESALRCIVGMRAACLEYEQPKEFNDFMVSLRQTVKTAPSSSPARSFWLYFTSKGGRSAGLITARDDDQNKISIVPEAEADKFLSVA